MLSAYGYPHGDGNWTIFYNEAHIPETIKNDVVSITVENQPEDGNDYVLRRNPTSGDFYWEPIYPVIPEDEEPPIIEQPTEPKPTETLEEKISRLFTVTEQNNLITVDAVLGVYEELVALREEVAALKGTSNNA